MRFGLKSLFLATFIAAVFLAVVGVIPGAWEYVGVALPLLAMATWNVLLVAACMAALAAVDRLISRPHR